MSYQTNEPAIILCSPDQLPYTTIAVYSNIGVYYDANLPKRVIIREVRCALAH